MSSNLNYIQYNEPMAGAGGAFTDTLNRALRNVLTQSGYNPDATVFSGFAPVFNLKAYGAAGDGITDDTAAVTSWAAAIQAAGGGKGVAVGTFKINAPVAGTVATFTSLNGVELDLSQASIVDGTAYTGTQEAELFKFVACNNVTVRARVSSLVTVTTSTQLLRGLAVMTLYQGCTNVYADLDVTGCRYGLRSTRLVGDSVTYSSRQIKGRIKASGCYYPLAAQFSGDDVDMQLDTDTCGRSFFAYGVTDWRIRLRSKNQQVTSLMKAYSGLGCRNMTIFVTDRDSTSNQAAAPRLALEWGDSTPATHANIDITLDVLNPSGSPFGNTFECAKYSDGGSTVDSTGRGHVLDGFVIRGLSDQTGGKYHITQAFGAFAAPDVARNIVLENLTLTGAASACYLPGPHVVLSGRAFVRNVTSAHNIYAQNGSNGEVIFMGCTALNYAGATSDTDVHTFISCAATDGTSQSLVNKAALNFTIGANTFDRARGNRTGLYGVTGVARAGAITTPNAQTGAYVQADVTSLKTAIDAIRTALTNVGITS